MKKELVDRFAAIAESEDVTLGEIERLPYVEPIPYKHQLIKEGSLEDIQIPSFDEEKEYNSFLKRKSELKEHYIPFLQTLFELPNSPSVINDLIDFDFRFECEEDTKDFNNVLNHKGKWEKIKLPHFVGPDGKFNAFYYKELNINKIDSSKSYILKFEASDYITEVYVNGRMVCTHEGFFVPFEVDISPYVKQGSNILVIVLKNELTTTGVGLDGQLHFGKKIYAATHFGYDEPIKGWHHCPAGIGIYGKLTFEVKNKQRVEGLLIYPDTDNSKVSGKILIKNGEYKTIKNTFIKVSIVGRNFKSTIVDNKKLTYAPLQFNENYVSFEYEIPNFKWWKNDEPFLYEMIVSLFNEDGVLLDAYHDHFGMRKFISDESSKPYKGVFYFNNERIILNATNEMGFLPLDVMRNDDEQLIDDILTAKVAYLNEFRMTQRPVLRKVYDYFDMLGMFCQTDLPLFSYISYEATGELFKQAIDMEKLVLNHPSCIIDSLINEALDPMESNYQQYVITKQDTEKILEAVKDTIKIINPNKIVKIHEGDVVPLKEAKGLTDFHVYCYWYVSHKIFGGYFDKGYLPGVRTDYMSGCGEYGVDGLDSYELMKKYAPKDWLPKDINEPWTPRSIARAQAWPLLSDFEPEQEHILDWIKVSREYQREAIKKYVHALRRRIDLVQYRSVHLLIDAWPMGWTKALVDVDRKPKPAYYAFVEANIPFRVSLRRDRFTIYSGEEIKTELFVLNENNCNMKGDLIVSVYENQKLVKSFKSKVCASSTKASYVGDVTYKTSDNYTGIISVKTKLIDENGNETFDEAEFDVKPKLEKIDVSPVFFDDELEDVKKLFGSKINENVIFVCNKAYVLNKETLEEEARKGKRVVLFTDDSISVLNDRISLWRHPDPGMTKSSNWVLRNENNKFTSEFGEKDFKNFYNSKKDVIDIISKYKFYWYESEPILYFLHDRGNPKYQFHKEKKLIMASKKIGKGEIIVSTLSNLNEFATFNPTFDKFIQNLVINK